MKCGLSSLICMLIDLWFVKEVLLLSLICMLIDLWFVKEVLIVYR